VPTSSLASITTSWEQDVNDHFASILHEDRMAEYRRDAAATARATVRTHARIRRRWTGLGVPLLAAVLAGLVLASLLFVPAVT
jgi:hypothetical protein